MRIGFGTLLAGVIVIGLGLGAGVAACRSGQQASQAVGSSVASAAQNGGGQGGQQQGAPAMGVVASVGDKEFSLKADSGASPIKVQVGDQTAIRKQVAAAASDIKAGERISVRGDAENDGSIAATTLQLLGTDGGMGAFGGQGQGQGRGQGGQAGASTGGQGQGRGQGTPSGGSYRSQGGAGVLVGTVKDVTGNVVTVTRPGAQGASDTEVKVTLSDKTSVTQTVAGEFKDIAAGAYVVAIGPRSADGTVTAASVQIMPADAARAMNAQQ